ncbi:MAG: hypothetical protein K6G85_09160 [Eubacterium sp.]|nr:hypothetical protein [Eubacterium sp.]
MRDNANISMEILLLNDLLNTHVIDRNLYDKAVEKIITLAKASNIEVPRTLLASA